MATAIAVSINGTSAIGTSTSLARADHNHAIGTNVVDSVILRNDVTTDANRAVTTSHIRDLNVTLAKIAADAKDQVAATASLRTLGTTATSAAAGNDTRFHTQGTDTGTTSAVFGLATGSSNAKLKAESATLIAARNAADGADIDFRAANITASGNLTVQGTTTTVNSNTLSTGDNIIELNNDITTTAGSTENAGLTVKRFTGADVRQDTQIIWDEASDLWSVIYPASAGTATVQKPLERVYKAVLGAIVANTPLTVTHDLNTQSVEVIVIEAATNESWIVDWAANGVNTVTVTFADAQAASAFRIMVAG